MNCPFNRLHTTKKKKNQVINFYAVVEIVGLALTLLCSMLCFMNSITYCRKLHLFHFPINITRIQQISFLTSHLFVSFTRKLAQTFISYLFCFLKNIVFPPFLENLNYLFKARISMFNVNFFYFC